jgi:membrane protein DedA with SNARE-associated domain
MENPLQQIQWIIDAYGIFAVFGLCMVEGDITLLLAGAMANSGFFGPLSFFKVLLAGLLGGVIGDTVGYLIGRIFAKTIKSFKWYQRSQPRIERLVEKFGGYALVISKYIYGIRAAMCISTGVGKMPFLRFLYTDLLSCSIWALILSTTGYFFGGAITSILGDFQRIGFVLLGVIVFGVLGFYLLERLWLSKKVESANPETIHNIEEKLHAVSENIQEKLHLTQHPQAKNQETPEKAEKVEKPEKENIPAAPSKQVSSTEKDG